MATPSGRPRAPHDGAARALDGARPHAAVALLTILPVVWLASADGGYFPQQWGWPALGLLLVAAVALATRPDARLSRLELLSAGSLLAYAGWCALSTAWSSSAAQPVLEVQRTILYVALLLAVLLVAGDRSPPVIAWGALASVTGISAYALATRLVPDRIGTYAPEEGYQLAEPLGYWNALGILATMGLLLAAGLAAHAPRPWPRALAGSSVVLLGLTLYFTFSRGALLALGAGAIAMAALDPRRRRLGATALALTPATAAAIWLAARADALTVPGSPLADAAREGHRVALALVPLVILSAGAVALLPVIERRVSVSRPARRMFAVVLLLGAVAAAAVVLERAGNPVELVRDEVAAFGEPLRAGSDLNTRLLNVSGNGRADYWRAAWAAYEDEPLLGTGAGGYEREWLQRRPSSFYARDAHNLYLETLAELGPVGVLLLLGALGTPLVAALRARGRPAVAGLAGAYAAFLAHAALDWDWEIPAVTVTALLCGAAVLVASREEHAWRPSGGVRAGAVVVLLSLVTLTFAGHLGNTALARSLEATASGDYPVAAAEARRARRWLPWSYEPWQRLAEARLVAGDLAGARRAYREAVERDPLNWALWHGLAEAGDPHALARARALNPRAPELADE